MDRTENSIDLASSLQIRTRALHRRAERSGVIADMLGGRVSRRDYAHFLRNLLPAYRAMELGLEKHRKTPGVREMARPEIYRSRALEADLLALEGANWRQALPLMPAGARYEACVSAAADGDGMDLIGHAYVRYLGDLSGGQILARLLSRSLGIGPDALTFYMFPQIHDIAAYKQSFREALNRSTPEWHTERVIDAAILAFSMNLSISESVCRAAASPPVAPTVGTV
jgi:heme oxygenase